jgi:hypothetical protein
MPRGKSCFSAERVKHKHLGSFMDDVEIIRLNVERYRRLLHTEVDETVRVAIQKMLKEFEAKLSSARPRANRAARVDPHQC